MARVPVIRVQQFTKGSLSAIGREVDRAEKNSRNEDIDVTRSELNVTVKEAEGGTLYRAWNSWRESHGCSDQKINKTMTAFEGAVLTASPEVFKEMGWDEEGCWDPLVRKRCEEFLMTQYGYLCEKIGEDRILSATIHFDEKTPHMQVYYVPAVDFVMQKKYAKDDNGRILRNEKGSPVYARDEQGKIITERVEGVRINRGAFWGALGGKNSYNQLQTEHYQHMTAAYPELNLERGQEGSTAEHTTKYQWQHQVQKDAAEELNKQVNELGFKANQAQEELDNLEKTVEQYKEANKEILTAAEVQAINDKAKVGMFGIKGVKPSEYEAIVRTAGTAEQSIKDKEAAEARAKAAEQATAKAKAEADLRVQQAVASANQQLEQLRRQDRAELEKEKRNLPSMKAHEERIALQKQVKELQKELDRMTYGIAVQRNKLEIFLGLLPGQIGETFFVESINKATGMNFTHSSEIVKYVTSLETGIEAANTKIKEKELER